MKPNDTSAIIPKFSDLFPNAPDQMEGETKEDFLKRVNKYVKDYNMDTQKVKYANPLDFTCSQAYALRTIQEIFELAKKDQHAVLLKIKDAVNLAKCFIELENVIKEVREKVKAK